MRSHFMRTWQVLSVIGQCDEMYGCEFWRIYHEWCAAGTPVDTITFIRRHTNIYCAGYEPVSIVWVRIKPENPQ